MILGFGDPDLTTDFDEFLHVSMDIGAYATALAEDRRVNHHDDLTTSLVEAEVDGERLTSAEVASFFILLAVAGNETTRNAISHGLLALTRYPEQRQTWWSDFDGLSHSARRGDRAMGVAGGLHAAHAHPRLRDAAAPRWPPATRSRCGTARPTATSRSSPTRGSST